MRLLLKLPAECPFESALLDYSAATAYVRHRQMGHWIKLLPSIGRVITDIRRHGPEILENMGRAYTQDPVSTVGAVRVEAAEDLPMTAAAAAARYRERGALRDRDDSALFR
ncbi:hypothetical protein JN531_017095 (plasmid) [Flagellatimonas centrodinii]|uniref:hypothetical protein n=1 Tax=Flagellatimonas centrodinii TaxID=2806210 RepID=UPI001FF9BE0E|nr:hypothetical protein [Flagellatimonas centrodinii]ULQ48350.1 hypothetical protein JN531_017095 [Flagellatimonas centrodinii]